MLRQPRREPQLRVAVRRSGVDVVDAVLEQQLERRVGLGLRERAERRGAEDRARALVAGAPEWRFRDHPLRLTCAECRYDLIAVGDVMLDGALPAPVAGARVHGRIELRAGGSAANAALAAARLGARAAVIGRVGADAAGRLVADSLAAAGVEPLLARDADAPTGCVVVVGGYVDRRRSRRERPARAGRSACDPRGAGRPGLGLLAPAAGVRRPPRERRSSARGRAGSPSTSARPASSRPSASIASWRRRRRPAFCLRTPRRPATLTGLEADEAALALARRYRVVCVKLGRAGALAATGEDVVRAEVQPVDRDDTLGAGDAFAGGFLVSLRAEWILQALRTGCDAAAAALLR